MSKATDGNFRIDFDSGRLYSFDSNNRISEIRDADGNAMSFAYDQSGRLSEVTDTAGRTIAYSYDVFGKLISVSETGGKRVEFTYGDGVSGNPDDLVRVTMAFPTDREVSRSVGFTYDTEATEDILKHNVLSITDAKGQTYVRNIYDGSDRVLSQEY